MPIIRHYGVEIDSGKPTTGVFQNNSCEWLIDEIFLNSIDLDFIGHKEGCQEEDHDYCYETNGSQTELIGFGVSTKADAWYWFPNQKIGYRPDPDAEYSAIVGECYTQVVASKWRIKCALCSPCYPGQGDADTPGDFLCFSLPPEVIGDGKPDRSRIFLAE